MSLILTIDTATEVCSVALFKNYTLLDFRENTDGKSHATLLTQFISDLLTVNKIKPTDLSAVAISSGPGSYTGLRIGVSAAKGICYGADIPLIAINTLHILTETIKEQLPELCKSSDLLCPMIDARRLEVYTSVLDNHGNEIEPTSAKIIDEQSFSVYLKNKILVFFGNGSGKCKEIITNPNARFANTIYPSAKYMGTKAYELFNNQKFENTAYFEPYYLKDFVATTPKNKVIK